MSQALVDELEETLKVCHKGYRSIDGKLSKLKLTEEQMNNAVVFLPEDVDSFENFHNEQLITGGQKCKYSCENIDSYSLAVKRNNALEKEHPNDHKKVLVLNFANPIHPGGGVRRGAIAQEEDLCRKSSLLLSLESRSAKQFYQYQQTIDYAVGSNAMVVSPDVEIIRDRSGDFLQDTVVVSVLTCAAPILSQLDGRLSNEDYINIFKKRIYGILRCAAFLNYRSLVLGAFGCGAFGNDAEIVAELFYQTLNLADFHGLSADDVFNTIDFAVLSKDETQYNFKMFNHHFGNGIK